MMKMQKINRLKKNKNNDILKLKGRFTNNKIPRILWKKQAVRKIRSFIIF